MGVAMPPALTELGNGEFVDLNIQPTLLTGVQNVGAIYASNSGYIHRHGCVTSQGGGFTFISLDSMGTSQRTAVPAICTPWA